MVFAATSRYVVLVLVFRKSCSCSKLVWTRCVITTSLFTPLCRVLVRFLGPRRPNLTQLSGGLIPLVGRKTHFFTKSYRESRKCLEAQKIVFNTFEASSCNVQNLVKRSFRCPSLCGESKLEKTHYFVFFVPSF